MAARKSIDGIDLPNRFKPFPDGPPPSKARRRFHLRKPLHKPAPIHRVVTGHAPQGRAIVVSDGALPTVVKISVVTGSCFREVWAPSTDLPPDPDRYASQPDDQIGRTWRKQQKAQAKLGEYCQRPKGMHHATREKLMEVNRFGVGRRFFRRPLQGRKESIAATGLPIPQENVGMTESEGCEMALPNRGGIAAKQHFKPLHWLGLSTQVTD
jgi:hypothetical protein